MSKHTILLVDDEAAIRNMLKIFLDIEGYDVVEADNGKSALLKVIIDRPGLIILDMDLPDIDGQDIIAKVRAFSNVPIIVLSAKEGDAHSVKALAGGANDFVVKPFRAEVLLARIGANLRSHSFSSPQTAELSNGPIRIDLDRHEVFINERLVPFTPTEFSLLSCFIRNKGRMLTHKQILKDVWGPGHADDLQYVRVYIRQTRAKLGAAGNLAKAIVSESRVGYRMDILGEQATA